MSVKRVSRRKEWSTLTYALERSRTLWKKVTIGFSNMKVTITLMRAVSFSGVTGREAELGAG